MPIFKLFIVVVVEMYEFQIRSIQGSIVDSQQVGLRSPGGFSWLPGLRSLGGVQSALHVCHIRILQKLLKYADRPLSGKA